MYCAPSYSFNVVHLQVVRALSAVPPSAATLDRCLLDIAKTLGIPWFPDYEPQQKSVLIC